MTNATGPENEDEEGSINHHYLILFVIAYALLVVLYFTQRRLARCFRRNNPVDESLEDQTCCLECRRHADIVCNERDYPSWTTDQVAHWAQCKLKSNIQSSSPRCWGSYYTSRGTLKTITALRTQCIDGKSIDHLTLQHLLSFNIPFGIAVHLHDSFEDLASNNSSERRLNGDKCRLRSDLVALPSWYEQTNQSPNGAISVAIGEEMDVEAQEHVQQIMQDRFGMNLPSLRENAIKKPVNNAKSNIEPEGRMEPTELAEIMQMTPTAKQQNSSLQINAPSNFDQLLENMPPHVRAIAERRPNLVSKLLSEMQPQNNSLSLDPVSEEQDDFLQNNDEDVDVNVEEVNYDTEMVGLLRRRTHNAPKR